MISNYIYIYIYITIKITDKTLRQYELKIKKTNINKIAFNTDINILNIFDN